MGNLDRQEVSPQCPDCGREMRLKYYDLINRSSNKCNRCYSEITFDRGNQSKFKSAFRDFERYKEKFDKAESELFSNCSIKKR